MNGRGHVHDGHVEGPHSQVSRSTQRQALWISLVANAIFMVVEVAGGIAFQSLALLADAAHMLSDVAGLGIALVAQSLVDRRATARHSYGLQRAEVLGAQANGLALLVVSAWIIYEAVGRIGEPANVVGGGLLVVATLGLVVNVASAILLARAQGQSLNMRGAFVHMAMDAAGSIAAIVAGDRGRRLERRLGRPGGVDPDRRARALVGMGPAPRHRTGAPRRHAPRDEPRSVEAALAADAEVDAVHHLHLWNLASDVPALSAHVVLRGEVSLHDAQARATG